MDAPAPECHTDRHGPNPTHLRSPADTRTALRGALLRTRRPLDVRRRRSRRAGRCPAGPVRAAGGHALAPSSDAPRLLGTAPEGDFQLSARVTVGFAGDFDAGVLYVHVGEREWAKLCFERSPGVPTICSVVTRGHSDDANSFTVDGDSVWLRVSRTGDAFAYHASTDGERWTFVRTFALGSPGDTARALVGFMVQSPVGDGCPAEFRDLAFHRHAPADLRDGS